MKSALEALYDDLFGRAEAIVKSGEEHQPIILACELVGEKYEILRAGPAMMADDYEKDLTASIIKRLVERGPQNCLVVFINEVWMRYLAEGEEVPADGHVDPKAPGSIEQVIFQFSGKEFQTMACCTVDHVKHTLQKGPLSTMQFGGRFAVHPPHTIN